MGTVRGEAARRGAACEEGEVRTGHSSQVEAAVVDGVRIDAVAGNQLPGGS